jgi:hypothetical protein
MPIPTLGSVAALQIPQPLLQVNSQRSEVILQNASTGAVYIGFGVEPSYQAYTAKLYTDDVLTTTYKGQIFAVFATTNGSIMVTEVS